MKLFLVEMTNKDNHRYVGVVAADKPRQAMDVFMAKHELAGEDFEDRELVTELYGDTVFVQGTTPFVLVGVDTNEFRP